MGSNTLLMPFLDASETFTLGFECGQYWQQISEGETFERQLIHTKNIKQIELICRTFGVECGIEVVDETWSYLTVKSITNVQA